MIGGAEPAPFRAIEGRWNQTVQAGGAAALPGNATVRVQSYSRFIPGASEEEAPASPPARQETEPVSVKST